MKNLGYSNNRINENISQLTEYGFGDFGKSLSDLFKRTFSGGVAGEIMPGDEESERSGIFGALRTMLAQEMLEFAVSKLGLDVDSTVGKIVKNIIEQTFTQMTVDDFKQIARGGAECTSTAEKVSGIVIEGMEEGLKEKFIDALINGVLGEFGQGFKTNKLTRGIYLNMRENISKGVVDIFRSEEPGSLKDQIAHTICQLSVQNILN